MNTLAPISRIPPEILSLIPDSWHNDGTRGQNLVALTHVCRSWRDLFTSRSSFWTYLGYMDADLKTRTYLERSKSSPIHVHISREGKLRSGDSLSQIRPSAVRRFESLEMLATPKIFRVIAAQPSHLTPLLKSLTIGVKALSPWRSPVIGTTFFNGDLSSLCELFLQCVRTELPWRNMVNFTSFVLACKPPGEVSTGQLLKFLESAPRLRNFELYSMSLASSDNSGRSISLAHLKNLTIHGNQPTYPLLDHLLVPEGAVLATELKFIRFPLDDHLLRSLDNLRNLSNFTQLHLCFKRSDSNVQFTGPNEKVWMNSLSPRGDTTSSVLESLTRFDDQTAESHSQQSPLRRTSIPDAPSHEKSTQPHSFSMQESSLLRPCSGP